MNSKASQIPAFAANRSKVKSDFFLRHWRALALFLFGVMLSAIGFFAVVRSGTQTLLKDLEVLANLERVSYEQWRRGKRDLALLMVDFLPHYRVLPDSGRTVFDRYMDSGQLEYLLWMSSSPNDRDDTEIELGSTNAEQLKPALVKHAASGAAISSYYSEESNGLRFNVVRSVPGQTSSLLVLGRNVTAIFDDVLTQHSNQEFLSAVFVYDLSLQGQPVYSQHYLGGSAAANEVSNPRQALALAQLRATSRHNAEIGIKVADRNMLLVFVPSAAYLARAYGLFPWLVLFGGVLTTALLAAFLSRAISLSALNRELQQTSQALSSSQKQLQLSEERYKLAAEGSAAGIWDWQSGQEWVYLSAQCQNILGLAAQPVWESSFKLFAVAHPDDREAIRGALLAHLLYQDSLGFTCRVQHSDGHYIWVHVSGKAGRDTNANVTRVVGSIIDVTAEQQAQEELLRSNQELDDFAYIASHDLKEPLRGIHNHVRFLYEDYAELLGEDGQHRVNRLLYLTQRMQKLINDLLSYSRLNREMPEAAQLDLAELLHDIRHTYLDRNEVLIEINGPVPDLFCNRLRIEELFRNLIANAIKYNESDVKHVTVSCALKILNDKEDLIEFSVSDNGVGIAPQFHDAIFKLFKRLHNQDQFGGGTGSGLTFVQKIVEQYQGKISVESENGKGARFVFTLPGAIANGAK